MSNEQLTGTDILIVVVIMGLVVALVSRNRTLKVAFKGYKG